MLPFTQHTSPISLPHGGNGEQLRIPRPRCPRLASLGILAERHFADEVLRDLKIRSVLPKEVANYLYYLKRLGNAAAHEDAGTSAEALSALKIARGRCRLLLSQLRRRAGFQGRAVCAARPAH